MQKNLTYPSKIWLNTSSAPPAKNLWVRTAFEWVDSAFQWVKLRKGRVKCHFCPWGLASFATSVQQFVFLHLDPKGLKYCHFHPAR
ncbi:hypothetical protein HanXRQr2_Chr12g0523031 [Helianthus annuus]|uniref:Uncharacterized protein n=1 Tax=Helianthus annuus TaxID=4232 RepID=A0A9K3EN37_HELAN|nr:hypothetical protein HanXRQr2_Chr12g0523031 [Helianthus annuus]KAJ0861205.1 hypothetical protein HanPSC8_Chr12g0504091 [Helianthus annuus]